jgi:putative sterol carrier protein
MSEGRGLPADVSAERYMEDYLPRALNRHAARLEGLDSVLGFELSGAGGGAWTLTVKDRAATVARGAAPDPRCTFAASAADWMELVRGRLNGPLAFMTGRVKIDGDYLFAMRLGAAITGALADLKK